MKKKLGILTATLIIASCGSSGSGNNPNASSTTTKTKEVTATVESSLVKGAKVCVKGTNNCAITDDNGTAHLKVTALPVELEVKIGDKLELGDVKVSSNVARINPIVLAGGDDTVAQAIASLIHALAGDTTGNSSKVDLSKVKIETKTPINIKEFIKENKTIEIKVKTNEEEHTVSIQKENGKITVKHDNEECEVPQRTKVLLWKLATFLTAANEKRISILSSETGKKIECTLEVNPENPNEFKLINCTDPEFNDDTWEKIKLDESNEVITIEDEDGNTAQISGVNLKSFTIKLIEDGETITVWISDTPAVTPELSEDEIKEKLEKGYFDMVYSYLSTKADLTDNEKVALAIAVLGKAIKDNLLVPAGYSIISPEGSPFFKVIESGNTAQLKELQEGAKKILTQIEKALTELDKVSDPQKVELPSELQVDAKTLDVPSLKVLKALLLYAKSSLEYTLAYDWNVYQDDVKNRKPSILKLASKLKLNSDSKQYLNASMKDFQTATQLLYEAGKSIIDSTIPSDGLTYAFIKPQPDGLKIEDELWTENNFETVIDNFKTIASSDLNSTIDIKLPHDPTDPNTKIYDHYINLSIPFTLPLTGEQIQEDVNKKNAIEINLCTSWYGYEDPNGTFHEECTEYERDILITPESNIYKFLERIYPDIKGKLSHYVQYEGKTYYSLQGFYIDPEYSDYQLVYPKEFK